MGLAFLFEIRASSDAQTLSRIINFFAQRDLILASARYETQTDVQQISLVVPNLDPASAHVIAEKMRSMVLVEAVEMKPTDL
ncbi:hypothetical protein [Aquisediminimonas profunda]|uniref:hypothetical protein n=1 Tax=Aquisediminimonas profunda TaxID=1550733 RepID=UPI001C636B61|nr:hypothetical protein [Aquisediminimonas profunda]